VELLVVGRVRASIVAAACAVAAGTGAPSRAWGVDVDVRAETVGQAYQVRGPTGAPVISSRRITQTLSLALVQRPADRRGVTVAFRARLRIDADFGEACDPATDRCLDEVNRERSAEFVPLFARRTMDLPFAYLDVTGIGRGALDVRVGRIFTVDPLGFFLFDGARARLHIARRVVAELYGGIETRAGFPLSSGRFDRDSLIREDRTGWSPALAPYVEHRTLAGVVAAALETENLEPLYARLGYRRVWTGDGVAEERAGGTVELRLVDHVRLFADAVYSIPHRWFATADAGAEWYNGRGSRAGVEVARYRPTFDLTSIWSAFWIDPTDDVRAYGEWAVSTRVSLTASWLLRRYALSESGTSPNAVVPATDVWNSGGSLAFLLRAPGYQTSVRARAEGGGVGVRAGLDADAWWWVVPERLRLDARFSVWHVADDLRPDRAGVSVGGVLGATVRLGRVADLHLDVEDDANRLVGHRFRALAIVALRGQL
jgi:hypothetical protein